MQLLPRHFTTEIAITELILLQWFFSGGRDALYWAIYVKYTNHHRNGFIHFDIDDCPRANVFSIDRPCTSKPSHWPTI